MIGCLAWRTWILFLFLTGLGFPGAVEGQERTDSLRLQVIELLQRSPLLDPSLSVVREARFVQDVRGALEGADKRAATVDNVLDATWLLEQQLAGDAVTATIQSVPSGLVVRYFAITDPGESALDTTTDDTLSLRPALYVFQCDDPATGETTTLRRPCATNCRVVFNFGR